MKFSIAPLWLIALSWVAFGDDNVPATKAYDALRTHDYDVAIPLFRRLLAQNPKQIALWKDLAYTLLKAGQNESARDAFAEAMKMDAADSHLAMEYAFLAFETNRKSEARRIFNRIRTSESDAQTKQTAETAFQNIDHPLADGIARWQQALAGAPENFSAHEELARLAEDHDELELAAEHYLVSWKLKPDYRVLLVDLGRVRKALGQQEKSLVALLAASRGAEPHTAEKARELLPDRYPYVYEFRQALQLDPANVELHRELAYLLLTMTLKSEAEQEFRIVTEQSPNDLLSQAQLGFLLLERGERASAMPYLDKVMNNDNGALADRVRVALKMPQSFQHRTETPRSQLSVEAKQLALSSYEKGYMKDALKYLRIAHESDPVDFQVMLKLGWVNNMLRDDAEAIKWFGLAQRSPDETIAREAAKAYRNLSSTESRTRTTFWSMPLYSSRWHNLFDYSQVKTEFKLPFLPVRPYFSMRFVGDVRGSFLGETAPGVSPQYFSENSVILGVGVGTPVKHGVMAWAEAGTAIRYLHRNDLALAVSDYRGGISFARTWRGPWGKSFFETNDDAVFISRFHNDGIFYSQNKLGWRLVESEDPKGVQASFLWNFNLTADVRRQAWANFVETGPGLRVRLPGMPTGMLLTTSFVRGAYLLANPPGGKPYFLDMRVGLWYAISH